MFRCFLPIIKMRGFLPRLFFRASRGAKKPGFLYFKFHHISLELRRATYVILAKHHRQVKVYYHDCTSRTGCYGHASHGPMKQIKARTSCMLAKPMCVYFFLHWTQIFPGTTCMCIIIFCILYLQNSATIMF